MGFIYMPDTVVMPWGDFGEQESQDTTFFELQVV